jgi:O-antigen/teichoic acid export membrane protein
LPTLANTILLPLLLTQQAESSGERSFFYFRHIMPGLVLVWGVFCTLLACGGYVLIPLVFKPEFSGAALPTWILLASSVFWIPVAVGYAAYANAISATYISLVAACFSAGANLAANFYLIPRYGLAGCAWATLAAYVASVAVFSALLKRSSDIPYSWTFLAFLPSMVGAVLISYYEIPVLALFSCIAASLVVAIYRRHSMSELYGFVSGFWRTN